MNPQPGVQAPDSSRASGAASDVRFHDLIDALPHIVWTASPEGQLDFYNQQMLRYTGFSAEDLAARGWQILMHPDDVQPTAIKWFESVRTGSQYEITHRIRHADGTFRWVISRAEPSRAADGRIIRWCGTAVDIHEHKMADEQIRRAQASAEAASRAKDRFLAALSHELRTPLNPALLILTSMVDHPALPAELREDLLTAKRNIELETHLIDDLLDVTRITQGKLHVRRESIHLHTLLRDAWAVCSSSMPHHKLRVVWQLEACRDLVTGDQARLQQVFWNLLKNAVKFTPEDGQITISSRLVEENRIQVEVKDNGIGITREALKKIFAPFEQGTPTISKVFGGLGLGLAIAKGIIEIHGGVIRATSAGPGRGATFSVELPLTSDPVPDPTRSSPSTNPAPSRPLRVLLVEDHADTSRTMVKVLRTQGHNVVAARTKSEAQQLVEHAPLDIVITDLGLPDGSGRDLIRHLKRCRPDLPVVALSGFGMAEDIEQSLAAGAIAHLTKPLNLSALAELLDAVPTR